MLKRRLFLWWLAAFLLLGIVFVSGVLHPQALPRLVGDYPTRPMNARPHFDRVSELLVENLINARVAGSTPTLGGFMFRIPGDPRIFDVHNPATYNGEWRPTPQDLERREIYSSQFGLQGRFYAAAAAVRVGGDAPSAVAVLRGVTAACLAAMLALLILLIRREWGVRAALCSLAFCAVSTGFNLFAPSLYWITFAHVAPAALVSAALLMGLRTRLQWGLVHVLLFLLFLVKFLSGFEFLTVTIMAAALPLVLVYSSGGISGRVLLGQSALVLVIGLTAFVAAIVIHHVHHQNTLGESGLLHLLSRSENWAAPAERNLTAQVQQFAKVLLVNFIDFDGYGIPTIAPFAAGALSLVLAGRALVRRSFDDPASRILLTIAAAFLVSLSWMVLQAEHVAFHPRYATILMAYPFGIFLAGGVAKLLEERSAAGVRAGAFPLGAQATR